MSHLLEAYNSFSPATPRSQVSGVLQAIITEPLFALSATDRRELIQLLLSDLKTCTKNNGNKGRLTTKDVSQALTAVKTLGKNPAASEVIATVSNLSTLLVLSDFFKDDLDASNEALRCVANALLLVESARATWVGKEVGGGQACIELLEKSTSPDRIFLACRILFLCTASLASSGSYIRTLVEDQRLGHSGNIVNIIGAKLDALVVSILGGVKMSREAMTDLLKLTFNLLVHYPKLIECEPQDSRSEREDDGKVMGDYWSSRLDGILPPLLRVFNTLPPSFPAPLAPPLTHVIHSLITIPVSPSLYPIWFNYQAATSPSASNGSSRSGSSNSSPVSTTKPSLPTVGSRSASPSPASSKEGRAGAVDRALSVIAASRRSLSRSSSPSPSTPGPDILLRAHDLLEVAFSHYMPGRIDPDDTIVRDTCKKDGDSSLDDLLVPLVVLVTRLCLADEASRKRTRDWLLPPDLDRTRPLEGRGDLLGRCLRLLGCVYHPRLKDSVGEMLFTICNSDATTLVGQVGYGNVAGYLFNKGLMKAPPPSSSDVPLVTPEGVEINPITGIAQEKMELPEMSEEEKEREAEKLFVLFERLEKAGAIPPSQNPIRKAVQEGKLG